MPLLRALREVDRVLLERLAILLRVLVFDVRAAADLLDRLRDRALHGARLLQDAAEIVLRLQRREHEQLARDVFVAALLRELIGDVQELREIVGDVDFARRALDGRQAVERLAELRAQHVHVHAGLGQQAAHRAALLLEQRRHQMDRLDELMVAADRERLRVGERLLERWS